MDRRVYGPVPSRRLGRSLGVNNIPHKICTYSCLYCQIGKAIKVKVDRQEFYHPDELAEEAELILTGIKDGNEHPDYITIVPDGEPTLDINLGTLIDKLKINNIPVAVISNASLINLPDVRADLMRADYVSLKADTFNVEKWRKINKPHKRLSLDAIIDGTRLFSDEYAGRLVTETMLLSGINDSDEELENTARVIATYNPDAAYIAIPTRPPAYKDTNPASESAVTRAYHIFGQHIGKVELLTGYEGNAFSSTGNFREDILSITAVHPMREDAVLELLSKTDEEISILYGLIEDNLIEKLDYSGNIYYLRKFSR